jgi:hypothetical protein
MCLEEREEWLDLLRILTSPIRVDPLHEVPVLLLGWFPPERHQWLLEYTHPGDV